MLTALLCPYIIVSIAVEEIHRKFFKNENFLIHSFIFIKLSEGLIFFIFKKSLK